MIIYTIYKYKNLNLKIPSSINDIYAFFIKAFFKLHCLNDISIINYYYILFKKNSKYNKNV